MKQIDTLAIVGLGLMGASLGLAVRARGLARHVVGSARREETRTEALQRGIVDAVHATALEAVRDADLVVFCLPVLSIPESVQGCRAALRKGCVVTDVGSTKAELAQAIVPLLSDTGACFVGSHPIAGSEQTGLAAARADLYANAVVVMTPPDGRSAAGSAAVRALWEGVGSTVVVMTPEAHDRMLARTSHLPHLAAAALVRTALAGDPGAAGFCGSGFRDTTFTFIAFKAIWHDIVKTNHAALETELAAFASEITQLRQLIADGKFDAVRRWLAEARRMRDKVTDGQG